MKDPKYKNFIEDDEIYVSSEIESVSPRAFEREPETERVTEKERVLARQATPRMEEEQIKPLQRKTPEVFGTLFDRIGFLKQRIEETKEAMEERKRLHDDMIRDIDEDIAEKKSMVNMISDVDEKRNFKLDISILRKEKRTESVNFWRDMTELRSELRELLEQYEVEKRIGSMFSSLGGKA